MALSGFIGGGAGDALEEIIQQRMLEEESQRRAVNDAFEREMKVKLFGQRQSEAAEDTRRFGVTMGQREKEAASEDERAKAGLRQRANESGVDTMFKERAAMDEAEDRSALDKMIPTLPPVAGRVAGLRRRGVQVGSADVETPDERRARLQGDADIDVSTAARTAEAQEAAEERHRPRGAGGLTTGQLTTAKQFQDDYARDSKTYTTVKSAYQQVAGAAQKPDAAGDLSLIFGYMKMLDPNSVVRETEFANAQNAAGVPDQVRNAWNRAMTGERLNPNQRQQFVGQARRLMETAHQNQSKVRKTYGERASKFEIDPSMVLDEEDVLDQIGGGAGGGAAATIRLQAPNGQVKEVPASEAERYIAKGAKVVQ